MRVGHKIRPAWTCSGHEHGSDCFHVTTDDDQPPKDWVRRWRGWGGWRWFCPTHDPKKATP